MNLVRLIALLLFLAALSAEAAIPAFCGDTVRGKASEACPSPDGDNDGYTTDGTGLGYDCDDANMWIYPGETTTTGCSAGEFKKCGVDGNYGACATITCSDFSTSNTCKYVDFDSGNDTTGTGTSASPWRSLAMVCKHAGATPSGWYDVQPGDTVFVRGTADSEYYEYTSGGGIYYFCRLTVDRAGTSGNYVTIMTDPAATSRAAFDGAAFTSSFLGQHFELYNTDWIQIKNVEIKNGYLTKYDGIVGDGGGIWGEDSADIKIVNTYIHDLGGEENYNTSGIYFTGSPTGLILHHNVIGDIYDPNGDILNFNYENNTAIVLFRGGNNSIKYNILYYTQAGSDHGGVNVATGNLFKYKHASAPSIATTSELAYNVFANGIYGYQGGQPKVWIHHNRFLSQGLGGYNFKEPGGPAYMYDYLFEYNTVYDTPCITGTPHRAFNCDGSTATDACSGCDIENIVSQHNICIDTDSSYTGSDGIQYIYSFIPDGIYDDFISDGEYTSDNNCYYNPNTTVKFSAANTNDGNTSCSGRGNLGGQYTFAQWQALGFDALSHVEDPDIDSDHIATSTNCSDKGWRLTGGATTTTTTTTTTTSSTLPPPAAIPGGANRRGHKGQL